MSLILFPVQLDTFTDPTPADELDSPAVLHDDQHAKLNQAVRALEVKVGANNSADASSIDNIVARLLGEVGGLLNLSAYCTGVGEESSAFQDAVNDAVAQDRALYHPLNLSVNVGNHVTQIPDGLVYFGKGELWSAATVGDGTPQTAFAFLENVGWQTAAAGSGITVRGIRFRRSANVDGTQGPYDAAIRLRGCTKINIDVETTGGMAGVVAEGCDYGTIRGTFHEPGDAGVRLGKDWGAATVKDLKVDARVYNAGYQLDGATAIPTGIAGSAVVCTQSGVKVKETSVNSRYNAFETGDLASGMELDITSLVDINGRSGNVLLANCSDVTARVGVRTANGGKAGVNCTGAAGQHQNDIRIFAVGSNSYTAAGFENLLVRIGARSHDVAVHAPHAQGMTAVWVEGADIDDIDIFDFYSRKAARMGACVLGGTRVRFHGGTALRPGADTGADGAFRVGLAMAGQGAGCSVQGVQAYDEGASTMQRGFYVESGTVIWSDNESIGHVLTPAILKGTASPPVLTAPTYVT